MIFDGFLLGRTFAKNQDIVVDHSYTLETFKGTIQPRVRYSPRMLVDAIYIVRMVN